VKKIRKIKNLEKRRVIIMTNREVYENMNNTMLSELWKSAESH